MLCSMAFPFPHGGILPGPERLVYSLALSLRRKDIGVSVVTSFWNGGEPSDSVNGIQIYRASDSGDRAGIIGRAFGMNYATWGQKILHMREVFREADLVHAFSPLSSAAAIQKLGIPIVATFYHLARIRTARDALSVPWQYILERHTFRHADMIITPSLASRKDLEKAFRVPRDRIRLIPLGVEAPSERLPEGRDERKILYVGILERRKGIEALIRATAQLRPDYPDLHLTIVGRGPSRSKLERLARMLNLHGSVSFPGYVSDTELRRLYARSGIFVLPSLQEGFGIVLLEAMVHGLPVVTTAAGSIPEVVENCAICVRPGDTGALAAGLRRVLDDASLRQELSDRGKKHVLRNFSWEATAEKTVELYQSLVGREMSRR